MRDGVTLSAILYRLQGSERRPVVLILTPYTASGGAYIPRSQYLARHGYVSAMVDCRGRGNSGGHFEPLHDAQDGYDIVEWLARQPWSDGRVGMWGGSYNGFTQWAAVKELPPHLATIVPSVSAHPGIDMPFASNIFYPFIMQWLTLTSGATLNSGLFGGPFWTETLRRLYLNHLPFRELDRIAGNPSPDFQTWLEHPALDAYWDSLAPTPDQYRRITIPILTITGHYDGDQRGALEYYRRHMQYGSPEAIARHYLVIGPWSHGGTQPPKAENQVGGLKFGEASSIDVDRLHADWFDWVMRGGPRPEFLKKRVAYYVAAADQWKYADSLEGVANGTLKLFLGSADGRPNDVFHSGALSSDNPTGVASDTYTYDPLDVRPAELEREGLNNDLAKLFWGDIPLNQSYALNLFGNGLVYHSEPLAADIEVSGTVRLVAWMSLDVPDTDFMAALYEILADGTSVYLTSDFLRARYRESLRQEKLVTPGQVNRYEFSHFQFFARRLGKNSRLRLVITCPNSIYLEKNYNGGGKVAEESGKDARTAVVILYHDVHYLSFLELPIVK